MLTHRQLGLATQTNLLTIAWMIENSYIATEYPCVHFNIQMRMVLNERSYYFRCIKCTTENSFFKGHHFFNSNLKIYFLIAILYYWSIDLQQQKTRNQIETRSRKPVGKWYLKLQKLCFLLKEEKQEIKLGCWFDGSD
jgi:hypothetical protein